MFDCQTRRPAPFVDQVMTGTLEGEDCRNITDFTLASEFPPHHGLSVQDVRLPGSSTIAKVVPADVLSTSTRP